VTEDICSRGRSKGRTNVLFSGPNQRSITTPEIDLSVVTGSVDEILTISFGLSVWGGVSCDPLDSGDEIVAEIKFQAIPDKAWQSTYRINFSTFRNTDYTIFSFSLPTSRLARLLRINPHFWVRLRQLTHDGADKDVWTLKEFIVGVARKPT